MSLFELRPQTFGAGPVQGVNMAEATARTRALARRVLQSCGLRLLAAMKRYLPADTGYARAHISYALTPDETEVRAGILTPIRAQDGAGVALYPLYIQHGIRRHFVSFLNRDGTVREMLVRWFERHGVKVWRSMTTGRAIKGRRPGPGAQLAMRGAMVWGYGVPWVSAARDELQSAMPGLLAEQKGRL